MKTKQDFETRMNELGACYEAHSWVGSLPADYTAQQVWDAIPRGDWLLWFAGRQYDLVSRKRLVKAACAVARTALKFIPAGELRPLQAIETAESWCEGGASLSEVKHASYAANAYAYAANAASAVAYAASTAAYAAYASAANAASYAANAAYAVAYAASAVAYAASARKASQLETARLVRLQIPEVPL